MLREGPALRPWPGGTGTLPGGGTPARDPGGTAGRCAGRGFRACGLRGDGWRRKAHRGAAIARSFGFDRRSGIAVAVRVRVNVAFPVPVRSGLGGPFGLAVALSRGIGPTVGQRVAKPAALPRAHPDAECLGTSGDDTRLRHPGVTEPERQPVPSSAARDRALALLEGRGPLLV